MHFLPAAGYPLPSKAALQFQYVGKTLDEVPAPAAVIDRAIVKRNCNAMLGACKKLGLGFRAHIKSHKTLELAKLQVGEEGPADFIVSTIAEAENLLPFLLECQAKGRKCSVLYGVPVPPSAVPRLVRLANLLEPYTLIILVDHVQAFGKFWSLIQSSTPFPQFGIFIKVDTGYGRAGARIGTLEFDSLVTRVATTDGFKGFYSHLGSSYSGSDQQDAMNGLDQELRELDRAASSFQLNLGGKKLTLSVGATPTATAAQNLAIESVAGSKQYDYLKERYNVELHAGVYPLLDLQQLATHARDIHTDPKDEFEPLSLDNIGLKILVEITSLYDDRSKPEALIAAGSLALGREPCKSYPGWGVVANDMGNQGGTVYDADGEKTGWIVGRISQEHGILSWEGPKDSMKRLSIGDKLLIWPNHACVAAAGFGWYLIIDSEKGGNEVVDVWVRWRGW